jgi:surfeit locus 1 family protein
MTEDRGMQAAVAPRRRPAWVPTVAALAAVALFVTAGNWQHRRMLEKQALQAQLRAAAALAPVPLPAEVADWNAWRFREVVVDGEYDTAHQILIDNKVHAGRAGYDVVTPLRARDGRVVLVDRGWTGVGPTRATLPHAPPPPGEVTLRARVDIPPARYYELGSGAPAGPLWQHLDPARFAAATGVAVLPIVLEALDTESGSDLVRDWPAPDTGSERHLSYMLQWYAFAALAGGLWLWFTFAPRRGLARGGSARRNGDERAR